MRLIIAAAEAEGGGVNTPRSVLFALLSALVLAALHLAAPRIRRLPVVPEHATASFAGGLAVSYVFLHLLPELSEGNRELREILREPAGRSPLLGLEIFLVALAGFFVFYALERLAEGTQAHVRDPGEAGRSPRDETVPEQGTGGRNVFRLHLASFVVYNGVIAYTLPSTWRTSVAFAVLFTLAIGLHFVLTDRGLEEHYGSRFDRLWPRLVLAGALLAGWGLAALFAPTSSVTVSVLTAFLAGGILLNVFKEEIPSTRASHLGWFATGLASYALLLGLVTATEESGGESAEARAGALSQRA